MGGSGISDFLYYESKFKIYIKKNIFFFFFFFLGAGGGGGGGRRDGGRDGARVRDFFTKNSNLKKIFFWGRSAGRGGVRWADRRTGPSSIYDHFII